MITKGCAGYPVKRSPNDNNALPKGVANLLDARRTKNAAPLAEGHGANGITKAEQEAQSLHSLFEQAEAIAKEMPLNELSLDLIEALHCVIEIIDTLEGDPDFEPWLGWTDCTLVYATPPVLRNGVPVRVMPYETNVFLDDREVEHDEENTAQSFANEMPWDEFSHVSFQGARNV